MQELAQLISDGSDTFLKTEFAAIGVFIFFFSFVILFVVEKKVGEFFFTGAFLAGAFTSLICGYIGMWISVRANVRTTKVANSSLSKAFIVAFRGGAVLGFVLVGFGLLVMILLIKLYKSTFLDMRTNPNGKWTTPGRQYLEMFEAIAGYGLGGSSIALFARVGGGIYTKAADVGADLVGKVVQGLDEDSIENPGTIADNVGDNVGDIAGMGADLFGSLAEASCACLVISGTSSELVNQSGYYYPLIISSYGIIVCFFTTFLSTNLIKANTRERVMLSLNAQLLLSTIIMSPVLYWVAINYLPAKFVLPHPNLTVSNVDAFWCTFLGLWSGYAIGFTTNYYTSGSYNPVKKLARQCV